MSLADTQNNFKKYIAIAVAITAIYYIGKYSYEGGRIIYNKIFPPPIPTVTAAFGPLPKLRLTSQPITGTPQYSLETSDGKLPSFPDRLNVYKFTEPTSNLLNTEKTKKIAKSLGFEGDYSLLSTSDYKWIDGVNKRTLQANIVTQNFNLQTVMDKLASVVSTTPTIIDEDAQKKVDQFIQSEVLVDPSEIDKLRYSFIPSIISFGKFRDTFEEPKNSKITKVNVYRTIPIYSIGKKGEQIPNGEYKIYGPNPKDSLINFFVTNDIKTFIFPLVNFTYWPIDFENKDSKSDYFLSPIDQVWGAVQSGQGVITYAKLDSEDYYDTPKSYEIDKIQIREISLAYFEPRDTAKYLQPIYVFEGKFQTKPKPGETSKNGEITIYYPALRGDHVQP